MTGWLLWILGQILVARTAVDAFGVDRRSVAVAVVLAIPVHGYVVRLLGRKP